MASISIVIPVYNEEKVIGATLERLRAHGNAEVIVVDGGSNNTTWKEITSSSVKAGQTGKKRAKQTKGK
jgi:glycosyltransferase involved in cell wall biosynthesis